MTAQLMIVLKEQDREEVIWSVALKREVSTDAELDIMHRIVEFIESMRDGDDPALSKENN